MHPAPRVFCRRMNSHQTNLPIVPARGKRLLAGLIDLLVAVALGVFVLWLGSKFAYLQFFKKRYMIIALLPALYLVLRDSIGGKSIGKLVAGIKVVRVKSNNVGGFGESLLRNFAFALLGIPLIGWFVGGAMIVVIFVQIMLGKEQRLGDRFAGTMVIDDRTSKGAE